MSSGNFKRWRLVTTVRVRMWRFTCFLLIEATGNTRQTGGLFCVSLQCERKQTSPLFPRRTQDLAHRPVLQFRFKTSLDAMPLQDSGSIHAARICAGRKIAPPETRLKSPSSWECDPPRVSLGEGNFLWISGRRPTRSAQGDVLVNCSMCNRFSKSTKSSASSRQRPRRTVPLTAAGRPVVVS
jgi:hypothetical protein